MLDYNYYSNHIISSSISGLIEVIISQPIEYSKTIYQTNRRFNYKHIFNGITARLIGVIPMRTVFWSSMEISEDYLKPIINQNKLRYLIVGSIAGFFQSFIDGPIDYIKTIYMIEKNNIKYNNNNNYVIPGFYSLLYRNMIFASLFNYQTKYLKDKITNKKYSYNQHLTNLGISFISSPLPIIITQPFDYIKTIQQIQPRKNIFQIIKETPYYKLFYCGLKERLLVTTINMTIGYPIYQYLFHYLSN